MDVRNITMNYTDIMHTVWEKLVGLWTYVLILSYLVFTVQYFLYSLEKYRRGKR